MMGGSAKISELVLYPVKGLGGIALDRALCTSLGLATVNLLLRDRAWVIVKPGNGKFITQRQEPTLALIRTSVDPPEALYSHSVLSEAALVLSAPNMPDLRVPITPKNELKVKQVTVWDWTGDGLAESSEATDWLTHFLGAPAALVRHAAAAPAALETDTEAPSSLPSDGRFRRPVSPMWADPSQVEISFADQFPFLLASTGSLANLNRHLPPGGHEVPMNRFRPNIIVEGVDAWEEDSWLSISIGDAPSVTFDLVKPCSRCKVPTIDQATGLVGHEPIRTMHDFRTGNILGWNNPSEFKHSVFFGVNMCLVPGTKEEVVSLGDGVAVLSLRSGPPVTRIDANAI